MNPREYKETVPTLSTSSSTTSRLLVEVKGADATTPATFSALSAFSSSSSVLSSSVTGSPSVTEQKAQAKRTAHIFDFDNTLTKKKMIYGVTERDEAKIARNIKSGVAKAFRCIWENNGVVAIVTHGNTFRVVDHLRAMGLTKEEISRITICADNKDEGDRTPDFKRTKVAELREKWNDIKKCYYYDDEGSNCDEVDKIEGVSTFTVSQEGEYVGHLLLARKRSSDPKEQKEIDAKLDGYKESIAELKADNFPTQQAFLDERTKLQVTDPQKLAAEIKFPESKTSEKNATPKIPSIIELIKPKKSPPNRQDLIALSYRLRPRKDLDKYDLIDCLEFYLAMKKNEDRFAVFMTQTVKTSAVKKMIHVLSGTTQTFSLREIDALREGELGKIISKFYDIMPAAYKKINVRDKDHFPITPDESPLPQNLLSGSTPEVKERSRQRVGPK